ncbi:DNA-binding HxlR family transcriptional regulator [Methanococcus maripaludis]|uniref:DNA-binding HxlR family transcriptional regulator n=1 Tax=Methanococcus maripaludis TaxID=39152 RepID=A0A7J9PB96_METMI|nr:MarR family transcriptional regulator [Methanococcus maripaludis]MBA2858729.1 DNA-binding HxlR family transcriptional regulator [Methanococcus maripaludis]
MPILKTLSKKKADEVLFLLKEHEELYFNEIQKGTNLNPSNLTLLLNNLLEEGFIQKRKEEKDVNLPKAYYSLTELGLMSLIIFEDVKKLEEFKKILE